MENKKVKTLTIDKSTDKSFKKPFKKNKKSSSKPPKPPPKPSKSSKSSPPKPSKSSPPKPSKSSPSGHLPKVKSDDSFITICQNEINDFDKHYEQKINLLINKIKNQNLNTDNRIRFGWKNK